MTAPTRRWVFHDPVNGDTYMVPRNPNAMTEIPEISRQLRTAPRSNQGDRLATVETPDDAQTFTFAGRVANQDHYDQLLAWAQKSNEIVITDHLGRSFMVFITVFRPEELRPTPHNPWNVRYTIESVLLATGTVLAGVVTETDSIPA